MTLRAGQNNGQLLKKNIHVGLFAINMLSRYISGAKIIPINAIFFLERTVFPLWNKRVNSISWKLMIVSEKDPIYINELRICCLHASEIRPNQMIELFEIMLCLKIMLYFQYKLNKLRSIFKPYWNFCGFS